MELTIDNIQALVELATEKNLAELVVEQDDAKLVIKTLGGVVTTAPAVAVAPAAVAAAPAAAQTAAPAKTEEAATGGANLYKVTAPMVGTFYRSPSPNDPAFVEVGSKVNKGQALCIIEAMKLMNELESEVSGIVRKINVENGAPVEYGQVLMEIEVQ